MICNQLSHNDVVAEGRLLLPSSLSPMRADAGSTACRAARTGVRGEIRSFSNGLNAVGVDFAAQIIYHGYLEAFWEARQLGAISK